MKISLQNLCTKCEGKGWYVITVSAHHPNCDCDTTGSLCPIPQQQQQQCDACLGTGLIKDMKENRHRKPKRRKDEEG